MSRIFKWIAQLQGKDVGEVLREWHSFWIGWAEMVCLGIPAGFARTHHAIWEMKDEEHYYHMGRSLGIITIVVVVKVVFF